MERPFCPQCGFKYSYDQERFPRKCHACSSMLFMNPFPVVNVLVPVIPNEPKPHVFGLLIIKRARMPGQGLWALPGGFIEMGETWQQAAAREVLEETNKKIDPETLEVIGVENSSHLRNLIILAVSNPVTFDHLEAIEGEREVLGFGVYTLESDFDLAFTSHTNMARKWLVKQHATNVAGK